MNFFGDKQPKQLNGLFLDVLNLESYYSTPIAMPTPQYQPKVKDSALYVSPFQESNHWLYSILSSTSTVYSYRIAHPTSSDVFYSNYMLAHLNFSVPVVSAFVSIISCPIVLAISSILADRRSSIRLDCSVTKSFFARWR